MTAAGKRAVPLFWRAVCLRCPNCGGKPLFRHWLFMRERCPVCGIRLARGEEGYQVGAYPPWDRLLSGGVILMVAVPFVFYPYLQNDFPDVDLVFRPPAPEDFADARTP